MTNEEYKQFINEYCRNVGSIKIKCDDCKFVGDCVDYGWQECKKFTPKPSEPLTNEEYIRTCSTEELAKLIYKIAVTDVLMDRFFTAEIVNAEIVNEHIGIKEAEAWLKEKHEE